VQTLSDADTITDGERLPLSIKDMGACEIYPQTVAHNPNGRFCVVCGDGEYIIYTSMALRNKAYGSALEFVWSTADSNMYATRESATVVKLFKNFKECNTLKTDFAMEAIYGGALLGGCLLGEILRISKLLFHFRRPLRFFALSVRMGNTAFDSSH